MAVKRARRLAAFWSWLPAFRAVAETEHLPSASALLNVTASSLSRTIRLLEEELDMPLFARVGRSIQLNERGETLLGATREAMRLVHEALLVASGDTLRGPIHCSAPSPFVPIFLTPAIRHLATSHPECTVHVRTHPGAELVARLRQGALDVALCDEPIEDPALLVSRLCVLKHDVFVGDPALALEDVVFVTPPIDRRGVTPDAWPADRPRNIGVRVDLMQVAIDMVRSGAPYGAVLPEAVGQACGLHPLGLSDAMTPSTLFIVRRKPLPLPSRADVLSDLIIADTEQRFR